MSGLNLEYRVCTEAKLHRCVLWQPSFSSLEAKLSLHRLLLSVQLLWSHTSSFFPNSLNSDSASKISFRLCHDPWSCPPLIFLTPSSKLYKLSFDKSKKSPNVDWLLICFFWNVTLTVRHSGKFDFCFCSD